MLINRRRFLSMSGVSSLSAISAKKRIKPAAPPSAVNVRDYGAVGDGHTDDTLAIQKLIDLKRSVYFPTGTYKVNGLNLHSNCTYYGDGAKSIIQLFQKTYPKEEVDNQQYNSALNLTNVTKVRIHHLKFICPTSKIRNIPATEYANVAIDINKSDRCQLESLIIEQFSGIAIRCAGESDTARCTNILIDKVRIGNWYNTYDGSFPQIWFYKYVHDSVVQNSSVEGGTFGIGFFDAYYGIKVDGQGTNIPESGVYRCKAINNIVKNQSRYGILLYCTRSVAFPNELVQHIVKGNKVSNILGSAPTAEKSFGAGIYVVGVTDVKISNNTVSNCNQLTNSAALAPGCIGVVNCFGNISIDGNTCYDGKWSNLYLNNINVGKTAKLMVTNNVLRNSIKENLFCANCNNAVFSGNKISSDRRAKLTPVSFRSVTNTIFRNNKIFFNSTVEQDGLFLYQSSGLKILNNNITTLNNISVNRIQEVNDSIVSGNIYNSANSFSQEIVRSLNSKGLKFMKNTINKPAGGKKFMGLTISPAK
jgi:hypothetical protein